MFNSLVLISVSEIVLVIFDVLPQGLIRTLEGNRIDSIYCDQPCETVK